MKLRCSLLARVPLLGVIAIACSGEESPLGGLEASTREEEETAIPADAGHTSSEPLPSESLPTVTSVSQNTSADLPGTEFEFTAAGEVYIDLSAPRIVSETDRSRTDWDLRFEGLQVFTNGGASGAGDGAAFGPSTELDILFDTVPDVPMRADTSDGAMNSWFWYSDNGIASRFHVYGLRVDERLFKLQVLSYYGSADADSPAAIYTIRYAEVTEDGSGETRELAELDASAGGVSAQSGVPTACLSLATGSVLQLTGDQRASSIDWDVCFLRTDVIVNGGLSGRGDVAAVDLDLEPTTGEDRGLTDEEQSRTADSERPRFEAINYDDLTVSTLPWDKEYEVLPRIGGRWLQGTDASPVPGTWFVRGGTGDRHYAVLFTSVAAPSTQAAGSGSAVRIGMQVKPLIDR